MPQTHYQNTESNLDQRSCFLFQYNRFPVLHTTGWFKHKIPKSLTCQCPRHFWELDPEILRTCLRCPCRRVNDYLFNFSPDIWGFGFLGGYLGLNGPHIFDQNDNIRERPGSGTLKTCAKFQGLNLKNGVNIWTFVRLSAKVTAWRRNYLVLVYFRFRALNMT